ncbi:MAG: guanylate kinase [Candidatus Neomarinimicrobiota bacterium]
MKNLIIISAPSGTGKTTLCKGIRKKFPEINWSISYTTRLKRPNEIDGKDYNFISRNSFDEYIKSKKLAEWENVYGSMYGTAKKTLNDAIKEKKILLLELDVKGALKLKKLYPKNTISIFIIPPSFEDLKKRLKLRNTESEDVIKIRLKRFEEEINYKSKFDYIMYNDILEIATNELVEIVKQVRREKNNGFKNITI